MDGRERDQLQAAEVKRAANVTREVNVTRPAKVTCAANVTRAANVTCAASVTCAEWSAKQGISASLKKRHLRNRGYNLVLGIASRLGMYVLFMRMPHFNNQH